ncbi:MAG: methylmalonyl-CoA mutase, partial [Bacteroidetes bacterium]|nr:methylmalonyl-CoA mutase [Bacteroidota bacterium]
HESVGQRQRERLKGVKAKRINADVKSVLAGLRSAASGKENLLPHILRSVEVYASVGEISDALRDVWGEHKE